MNINRFLVFCYLISVVISTKIYSQNNVWENIGDRLPNTVSTATISAIDMVGDSIWVCSGYGTYLNQVPGEIYFSSDRGKTFSIQATKYGTHAIKMLDSKRGYCGGVEGQIYRTSDGGKTWERWTSIGRTLMSIDFPLGSDTGFCTGFSGGVKMITATGLATVDMHGYVSNIYSVSSIDKDHAFVAGEEILGPVVDGVFQINQSYPGTNGIYAIDMVDTLYGWCVGSPTAAGAYDSSGCMIIKTVDGYVWNEQINPVKGKSGTLMAVKALNRLEAWAVGTSGVILHTTDGGENWIREAEGLTNEMLYGIYIASSNEVYVTGNNRTLLKYGAVSGVKEIDNKTSIKIFPNPFNQTTDISYQLTVRSHIVIKICDFLGREIITLTDGEMTAGLHNVSFDGSFLQAGIYIASLQVNGVIENKKMLIIR